MSSDVSRDPSDYRPRDHTLQRAKYRGIKRWMVAQTIEEGEMLSDPEPNVKVFVGEIGAKRYPVKVVCNVVQQVIISAMWKYE